MSFHNVNRILNSTTNESNQEKAFKTLSDKLKKNSFPPSLIAEKIELAKKPKENKNEMRNYLSKQYALLDFVDDMITTKEHLPTSSTINKRQAEPKGSAISFLQSPQLSPKTT